MDPSLYEKSQPPSLMAKIKHTSPLSAFWQNRFWVFPGFHWFPGFLKPGNLETKQDSIPTLSLFHLLEIFKYLGLVQSLYLSVSFIHLDTVL